MVKPSDLLCAAVYQSGVSPAAVRWLLEQRINPNLPDTTPRRSFPLHRAVFYAKLAKRTDIVRLLCEGGADPTLKDGEGKTAFDVAQDGEAYAPVADLLRTCARLKKNRR